MTCAIAHCQPGSHRGGRGVKVTDIPLVAQTGVDGFFVVSAVCGTEKPQAAAAELIKAWQSAKNN